MFKTFSAAALAGIAAAIGDDNGLMFDNHVVTTLIADKLELHLYNADNDGTDEVHGELVWLSATPGYNNREMGFCIRKSGATSKVDCMKVRFNVDPVKISENPAEAQAFDIIDSYATTVGTLPTGNDPQWEVKTDASINWRQIASKSVKEGCAAYNNNPAVSNCDKILVHWYRNFTTSETDYDQQLALEDSSSKFQVWGWMQAYTDANFQTVHSTSVAKSTAPVEVDAVF